MLAVETVVVPLLLLLRCQGGTQIPGLTSICLSPTGDSICIAIPLYGPLSLWCALGSSSEKHFLQPGDSVRGKSMSQLMWLSAAHLCLTLPSALVEILAFLNHLDPKLIPSLSMSPFSR